MNLNSYLSSIKRLPFSLALSTSATALCGLVFIAIASMALVELSGRISAKAFVSQKIDTLEKQVFSRATNGQVATSNEVEVHKAQLSNYQTIIDDLEHLSFTGANQPRETIYAIRHRLGDFSRQRSIEAQASQLESQKSVLNEKLASLEEEQTRLSRIAASLEGEIRQELEGQNDTPAGAGPVFRDLTRKLDQVKTDIDRNLSLIENNRVREKSVTNEISDLLNSKEDWVPSQYTENNFLLYLPSDLLLAITIILCGGIGSILAAFRSVRPRYAPAIFNGVLAGFVAFLVVKGGKFLLLIHISPETTTFLNPFAAAFAGTLAGLFTEKAYQILSGITDQVGEKILGQKEGVGEQKNA